MKNSKMILIAKYNYYRYSLFLHRFCKTIQILEMSMLIVVFFLYNLFSKYVYISNGPVVRALGLKANVQSSNLAKTL